MLSCGRNTRPDRKWADAQVCNQGLGRGALAHAAQALEQQTTGLRQSHQPLQPPDNGRLPDHFVQRAGLIGTGQSHAVSYGVQYE